MSGKTTVFIIALALGLIAISIFYFTCFHGSFGNQAVFGAFGDYFGGTIGAITALVSVVLIYFTYQQQVGISLKQFQQNKKMSFEQNFFNLLQVQRDLTKSIVIERKNPLNTAKSVKYEGYKAIEIIAEDVETSMMQFSLEPNLESLEFEEIRKKVDLLYKDVLDAYGELTLGHYFRHLYHILKYIQSSDIDDKKLYMDFLQAQMSNEELYMLFYDSLSEYGYPKMYNLVSNGLLENLRYSEFEYFSILCNKCYPNTNFKI